MRASVLAALLVLGCAHGKQPVTPVPSQTPAESPRPGAAPQIYTFTGEEIFGSRHLTEEDIRAFGFPPVGSKFDQAHTDLPQRLGEAKKKLLNTGPLAAASFNFNFWHADRTLSITVNLVDKGDEWRMKFTPAPTGTAPDPEGLLATWTEYQKTYWRLRDFQPLGPNEKWVCHHSFSCFSGYDGPELAPYEQKFIEAVPRNFDALVAVVREDHDPDRRMEAIMLLGFIPDRRKVVNALLPFVRDEQDGVRNEVLRAFGEAQNEQTDLILPLGTILDALWMPWTTDRNKSGWALVRILETHKPFDVDHILKKDADVLVTMSGMLSEVDWGPASRALELMSGKKYGRDRAAWKRWVESRGIPVRLMAP